MWTESIAIGTNEFVLKIYAEFGPLAKGRKIIPRENGVSFQIREEIEPLILFLMEKVRHRQ